MPKYKPNPDYSPSAEWLESLYFHHPDKGCIVYYASKNLCPLFTKAHKNCALCDWVKRARCTTHNKTNICRGSEKEAVCGWELGKHGYKVWLGNAEVPFESIKNNSLM